MALRSTDGGKTYAPNHGSMKTLCNRLKTKGESWLKVRNRLKSKAPATLTPTTPTTPEETT